MKKALLTIASTILSTGIYSQWINSITYFPVNPDSNDTIYFYCSLSFSSGNCDQHTQFQYVLGNTVYASALHCNGMLTFICSHTDTFKVDPLPAGTYTFLFHVDAGALPSPCTPGINPGPTDSVSFVVSPVTAIDENGFKNSVSVSPNPAKDKFKVQNSRFKVGDEIKVYDVTGKREFEIPVKADETLLDISFLENGIYFLKYKSGNLSTSTFKIAITK